MPSGSRSAQKSLSALCQDRAHEMQRDNGRAPADRLAILPVRELTAARRVGGLDMDVHEADRLLCAASSRPRNACHGHGDVGAQPLARAARHGGRSLGRNGAVLAQHRGGNAELALLHPVRVRNDSADEDLARPWNRGQPRADHPAGDRLRRCEREPALAAELEHDLLDRTLVLGEQMPPQPCA